MWINQKTLDALQIMAVLAAHAPEQLKATQIAELTSITLMNVQKTANELGQAGLIETIRGRNGGLKLVRAANMISLGEIVRAFEPEDCPINFLSMSAVGQEISQLLHKAHRGFFQPLEAVTLADLSLKSGEGTINRLYANSKRQGG